MQLIFKIFIFFNYNVFKIIYFLLSAYLLNLITNLFENFLNIYELQLLFNAFKYHLLSNQFYFNNLLITFTKTKFANFKFNSIY